MYIIIYLFIYSATLFTDIDHNNAICFILVFLVQFPYNIDLDIHTKVLLVPLLYL